MGHVDIRLVFCKPTQVFQTLVLDVRIIFRFVEQSCKQASEFLLPLRGLKSQHIINQKWADILGQNFVVSGRAQSRIQELVGGLPLFEMLFGIV